MVRNSLLGPGLQYMGVQNSRFGPGLLQRRSDDKGHEISFHVESWDFNSERSQSPSDGKLSHSKNRQESAMLISDPEKLCCRKNYTIKRKQEYCHKIEQYCITNSVSIQTFVGGYNTYAGRRN